MGFQQKIEEIRSKPEHIRVRYVWGAVTFCMFFVIIVWLFSIRVNFSQKADTPSGPLNEIREQFDEIETPQLETGTSIEDFIDADADLSQEYRQQQNTRSGVANDGVNSGDGAEGIVEGSSNRIAPRDLPTF